jgi:hypothetical protein
MDKMARSEPRAKDMTLAAPYEGILGRISELEKLEPLSGSNKKSQLDLITKVVNNAKSRHLQRMNDEVAKRKSLARPSPDGGHAQSTFTSLPIVERQDILRSLSAEYAADVHAVFERCPSFDSIASIRKVAASYAYLSTYDKKRESRLAFPPSLLHLSLSRAETKFPVLSRFPYDVAFRDLAAIKAEATGTSSTIAREFSERFVLHRASLKLL